MIRPDEPFDQRIADWLETDPVHAPREVLGTVLAAVPSIPQRRAWGVPWRSLTMTRNLLLGIAALAVVIALGGFALLSRSPSVATPAATPAPAAPSPAASPLALTSTFVSPTYGYSIGIADDWTPKPATLRWTGPDNTPPVVDEISYADTGEGFSVASEALLPGQTFAQWLELFAPPSLRGGCEGPAPSEWPPIAIGSETGRWQQMCGAGEAVIEHGGRAYVFAWGQPSTIQGISRDQFEAALKTVEFDPSAVPTPGPTPTVSEAFTSARNGYSLRLPAGWSVKQATTSMSTQGEMVPTGTDVDLLTSDTARLAITSAPLEPGETANAWARAICRRNATKWTWPCDQLPTGFVEATVGPGSGWLIVNGDSTGDYVHPESRLFLATAVSGGRGYVMRMDGVVDQDLFLAILASMTFDPASAVDSSPAP